MASNNTLYPLWTWVSVGIFSFESYPYVLNIDVTFLAYKPFHWSSRSKKTFLMSTPKCPGSQIVRWSVLMDPPIWNCQWKEWTLCWSISSMRPHLKRSTYKKILVQWQIYIYIETNTHIDTKAKWPPSPIWNSQLIRIYRDQCTYRYQRHMTPLPHLKQSITADHLLADKCLYWGPIGNGQLIRSYGAQSTYRYQRQMDPPHTWA